MKVDTITNLQMLTIVPASGCILTKYISGAPIETFAAFESVDVLSADEAKDLREISIEEAAELETEFKAFVESLINTKEEETIKPLSGSTLEL